MSANPALDLDSSPIPGQLAHAVLDLEGRKLRGSIPEKDATILFQMLEEAADVPDVQRLTVTLVGTRFVVSRDEAHVYIVQTQSG